MANWSLSAFSFERVVLTENRNLVEALREAEKLRRKMNEWPPKSSRGDGRGLIGVMDDELGFVD